MIAYFGPNSEAVSKVVVPNKPAFGDVANWNHRYLFVDFLTAEDAKQAAKATNGRLAWGVKIRVLPASPRPSRKIGEREAWMETPKQNLEGNGLQAMIQVVFS